MPSYRLPTISLEQYRLLPADEQYLLISSIHTLYERMLGAPSADAAMTPPALSLVPDLPTLPEAQEIVQSTPAQLKSAARQRAFRRGSSSAYIMEVMLEAGDMASLTPQEIHRRVSAKTTTVSEQAVWTAVHRLVSQGVLERTGDGRAGGLVRLKRN